MTEAAQPDQPEPAERPHRAHRPHLPHPPHVYVRRRVVAAGLLLALLVLSVAGILAATGHPAPATVAAARQIGDVPADLKPATQRVLRAQRDRAAVERTVARQPLLAIGSRRGRRIALTFDDGPSMYTAQIMRILDAAHVPATFFWLGVSVAAYPKAGWKLLPKGDFVIGDHTEGHLKLTLRTREQQAADIDDGRARIRWQTGRQPLLFRPPYGLFDKNTLSLLAQRKMLMVLWSVDSEDYTLPGAPAIVQNVTSGAKPGGIVLMHDGGGDRTQTIAALPTIIKRLKADGYTFVTIPEMLADTPPLRQPRYAVGPGYH